ncbi:transcriptional regulator, TetR family [Octadecabacter temperatus]|uniref:HTH-type transcriptional repressor ComR n=1 Tax=Octadecabacter temperatus TaxID=1458307 RepID=A0A0K0Y2L6_9RHOB|nr:TetR/AcrR family transcriptional regulator [Octadecabacter temperatus]AKS45165.1 HTH-type transcriptional repressor ComR [Octadecabacter temperatus]SIN87482.1 transcriptional regulator, TetR family [Octadecabacter temperatus]
MPKSQKVDREAALRAAGLAFMECGYSGMSTRDLEKRSGITKFTLQTKYGGKKALFLMTLDLYLDELLPWIDNSVSQGGIADFFRMRADDTRMPEQGRFGCLLVNALTEFGATDPDISTRTHRYFQALRSAFKSELLKSKNEGTLDMYVDIDLEAERLLVSMIGLNVAIRTHGSNSAAADMAQGIAQSVQ